MFPVMNDLRFLSFFLLLVFVPDFLQYRGAAAVPSGLVIPVVKDASNQYIATIKGKTPLLAEKVAVDLGAGFLWVNCESNYVSSSFKPVTCGSSFCNAAGGASGCSTCNAPQGPGCSNNCSGFPHNPFTSVSTSGDLSQDSTAVLTTAASGKTVGPAVTVTGLVFMCGSGVITTGLAAGAVGVIGLGRTSVSLASQLTTALSMSKKFAICLPSSTATASSPGAIFFGGGPFVLQPGVDVTKPVAFTKLIINPVGTAGVYFAGDRSTEYFVKLTGIKVNGKTVAVNTTLLDIHKSKGGTKISTVDPYTRMEKSIYTAFEAAFVKEAAAMGVKRVAVPAGKPFGACFNSNGVTSTRVGPGVPTIDLLFNGASAPWKVYGANSMVMNVGNGIMCLGFVNAGEEPRTSITIGAHQLEDNLIQFDLGSSTMGFSSSLLFKQTTCSNFNFKG